MDLARELTTRVVLLDGGLATLLESRGHDISSALWSAALLHEDPEAIRAAHVAYFEAGAEVAITASYQAGVESFAARGLDRGSAEALLRRSVALAVAAREQTAETRRGGPAWVAASIGPYGAMLAGGQEYTGDYPAPFDTVAALRAFHRPRMEVLAVAGADVLACETIPCLAEAEALLAESADLGVPMWLSLTTQTVGERVLTRRGEDAGEAFAAAADIPGVVAVGVNCTEPDGVARAVEVAAGRFGGPVVVYPNSGETWDAAARAWRGSPGLAPDAVRAWRDGGARLIGGCCRVGPQDLGRIGRALGRSR